jgi:hypothetical protein
MQRLLMIGMCFDNAHCEPVLIVDALAQVANIINGARPIYRYVFNALTVL